MKDRCVFCKQRKPVTELELTPAIIKIVGPQRRRHTLFKLGCKRGCGPTVTGQDTAQAVEGVGDASAPNSIVRP